MSRLFSGMSRLFSVNDVVQMCAPHRFHRRAVSLLPVSSKDFHLRARTHRTPLLSRPCPERVVTVDVVT